MNAQDEVHVIPVRASICMASYKGGRFIQEQIESILAQMGPTDELVIVDDASPDDTVEKIRMFVDARIRLISSSINKGYVRSFAAAASASRGAFIFLADQDDVWIEGRLERMISALREADVVASNFDVLGGGPRPSIPRLRASDSQRHWSNLFGIMVGYRAYYGCGMAFRRSMLDSFVPVPSYLNESHDLWLAICGNVAGSILHLDESTLLRRIHDENATPKGWRSLGRILSARLTLLRCLAEAVGRVGRHRQSPPG